jgi:hypothetical protein
MFHQCNSPNLPAPSPPAQERIKIMTIARGFAAAAVLAGLAVGTAGTAWAEAGSTMNGHYLRTETDQQTGQSETDD